MESFFPSGFDPDLESGPDVIMMMVGQHFRNTICWANDALCILPGNSSEDFNGRPE